MTETEAHAVLTALYERATTPVPAVEAMDPLHVVSWLTKFGPTGDAAEVRAAVKRMIDPITMAKHREQAGDRLIGAVEHARVKLEAAGVGATDQYGRPVPRLPVGLLPVPRGCLAYRPPGPEASGHRPAVLFAVLGVLPDAHPLRSLPADALVPSGPQGLAAVVGQTPPTEAPAWATAEKLTANAAAHRAREADWQAARDWTAAEERAAEEKRAARAAAARPVTAGEMAELREQLKRELAAELAAG